MLVGGCFCTKIRVELTGQPIASANCYCNDCRKLSGSSHTYNFLIKTSDLKITSGTPKEVSKTADSGSAIKNYFCADCGTPLFGGRVKDDGSPEETRVVRAGIFDDINVLNEQKPQVEIYTDRRLKWISAVEGAKQFGGNFTG